MHVAILTGMVFAGLVQAAILWRVHRNSTPSCPGDARLQQLSQSSVSYSLCALSSMIVSES